MQHISIFRIIFRHTLVSALLWGTSIPHLSSQCLPSTIFANDSTPDICEEVVGYVRNFYSNNLPPHPYGPWPSGNVPVAQDMEVSVCAYPIKGDSAQSIYGFGQTAQNGCNDKYRIGISYNSAYFAAWAARYFVDTAGQNNLAWNIEATTLSLDDYGAHVAGDEFHYHLPPAKYYEDSLGIDGSSHSPILGYAADGFPMYFKYGYSDPMNPNSPVVALQSCYQLKQGNRPGDGFTAPDGPYDGTYNEDYEHISSAGCDLDDCNGRFGVTPDFPNGTYYYVMTEEFPYMPRCFYGTVVDNSFRIGPNCPASTADQDCSAPLVSAQGLLSKQLGIELFPNPTSGKLRISTTAPEDFLKQITAVRVYNEVGQVVWESQQSVQVIDLRGHAPGTYFIEIQSDARQFMERILLQP